MFKTQHIATVIPAKGCSKGVPRKNLKNLGGIPMMMHTINAAKNSKYVDVTSIATEDPEIAQLGRNHKMEAIMDLTFPDENSVLDRVYEHNIKVLEERGYNIDITILLQPTSPLRSAEHLDEAIETFFREEADSLLSVTPTHKFLWKKNKFSAIPMNYSPEKRPVRQEKEKEYAENGAIYIIKKDVLYKEHCRLGGKIALYEMGERESTEIDNPFDFKLAEFLIENE